MLEPTEEAADFRESATSGPDELWQLIVPSLVVALMQATRSLVP